MQSFHFPPGAVCAFWELWDFLSMHFKTNSKEIPNCHCLADPSVHSSQQMLSCWLQKLQQLQHAHFHQQVSITVSNVNFVISRHNVFSCCCDFPAAVSPWTTSMRPAAIGPNPVLSKHVNSQHHNLCNNTQCLSPESHGWHAIGWTNSLIFHGLQHLSLEWVLEEQLI